MGHSHTIRNLPLLVISAAFTSIVFCGCGKGSSDPSQAAAEAEQAMATGDYGKAARLFNLAAESDLATKEILYNLGAALDKAGKPAEAADAFRKALALDPAYADAMEYLAVLIHRQGDPREAAQLLGQVLAGRKDGPARARVLNALAHAELDQGRGDLAMLRLLEAGRTAPAYGPTFFNLGKLYAKDAELAPEAIETLGRYKRVAPGDDPGLPEANRLLGELGKRPLPPPRKPASPSPAVKRLIAQGDDAAARGRVTSACSSYAEALGKDPASYDAAIALAKTSYRMKRYGDAIKACQKAARNAPEKLDPVYLEAQIAYMTGEYKHALDLLTTKAIPRWPSIPLPYQLAAYTLYQSGDHASIAPYAKAYVELSRLQGQDPSGFVKWVRSFMADFKAE